MNPLTSGIRFFKNARVQLDYKSNDLLASIDTIRNYFSIVFASQGTGIVQTGDKKVPFSTPVVLLFNEKNPVQLVNSKDLSDQSIFFHPSVVNDSLDITHIHDREATPSSGVGTIRQDAWLLRRLFSQAKSSINLININLSSAKKLSTLFYNIHKQFKTQPDNFWPCRGRSFFLELLMFLECHLGDQNNIDTSLPIGPDIDEITPVLTYIHDSYSDKINITELANRFYTNRTTLNEQFVRATGFTPINYLIKLRIRIASTLLQDTSIPLTEIIERTGFDDLSHFGRMFKKTTGVPPSEYRKRFQVPSYLNA